MMEDPQSNLPTRRVDIVHPIHKTKRTPSVSTSPEHSRARSKEIRAADQPSYSDLRPQMRRRESYADGTRRGRSRTRSVSPRSAKTRAMRRRRSRSPSRSCSDSATESHSLSSKKQKRSPDGQANDQYTKGNTSEAVARDDSRESMRTRSKRRKKYRRRSDYAAAGADIADIAQGTDLRSLRGVSSTTDANESGDVPHKAHE
jgi:hypothetical protein